ncbi:MAG TPA: hypothetical protein VFB41_02450 [Solirubrobacteraceae bacterium]|nr:hypothetical protein [Solirubrobacteraceae bacterium]
MDAAPVVTCTSCKRVWRSAAMAEGLRHVGHCPRCGGELEFHDGPVAEGPDRDGKALEGVEPHLALGIPKR